MSNFDLLLVMEGCIVLTLLFVYLLGLLIKRMRNSPFRHSIVVRDQYGRSREMYEIAYYLDSDAFYEEDRAINLRFLPKKKSIIKKLSDKISNSTEKMVMDTLKGYEGNAESLYKLVKSKTANIKK